MGLRDVTVVHLLCVLLKLEFVSIEFGNVLDDGRSFYRRCSFVLNLLATTCHE